MHINTFTYKMLDPLILILNSIYTYYAPKFTDAFFNSLFALKKCFKYCIIHTTYILAT